MGDCLVRTVFRELQDSTELLEKMERMERPVCLDHPETMVSSVLLAALDSMDLPDLLEVLAKTDLMVDPDCQDFRVFLDQMDLLDSLDHQDLLDLLEALDFKDPLELLDWDYLEHPVKTDVPELQDRTVSLDLLVHPAVLVKTDFPDPLVLLAPLDLQDLQVLKDQSDRKE